MAGPKDVVLHQLQTGQTLLGMFTADLSDEEYFRPPLEGANHAAWILGHIAQTEDWAVTLINGTPPRLDPAIRALFAGCSTCVPDPARYPVRTEMDELFRTTRAATEEALGAFDDNGWARPSPEGVPQPFFPTIGSFWGLLGTHPFWHLGQLTVCRQALEKPDVLFPREDP